MGDSQIDTGRWFQTAPWLCLKHLIRSAANGTRGQDASNSRVVWARDRLDLGGIERSATHQSRAHLLAQRSERRVSAQCVRRQSRALPAKGRERLTEHRQRSLRREAVQGVLHLGGHLVVALVGIRVLSEALAKLDRRKNLDLDLRRQRQAPREGPQAEPRRGGRW